jgi:hypothetical protein
VRYTRAERKPEVALAAPDIPPDYYWRYFRTVVDTALEHHRHLFTSPELRSIETALTLPKPAQQLYVRMFTRKGDLFRRSRLDYPEIGDLEPVLEQLAAVDLVAIDPPDRLAACETLDLLTIPELRRLAAELGISAPGRKPEVLSRLEEAAPAARAQALGAVDRFVELRQSEPFTLARVVFFGNRHQDQTAFVLVDLELSAYEDYPVSQHAPRFPARADLDEFLIAASRWDEGFERATEGALEPLVELGRQALDSLADRPELPPHRRRVDPARYDERVASLAGRELERAGKPAEALDLYRPLLEHGRRGSSVARTADRMGLALRRADEDPGELLERMGPWLESERLDDISRHGIELRLHRLGVGEDPRAALLRPPIEELTFEAAGYHGPKALYRVGEEAATVEEAVLAHLGGDGMWCENVLYTTLFGLLLWDVIFAPIDGMFQHPFQDGPLDYRTGEFFANRAELFAARMAELRAGEPIAELLAAHANHAPRRCPGVGWESLEPAVLASAAEALGDSLFPILERIGRHPKRHGRGLPDLFLWCDGVARLVEVKGPGDQVSLEQSLWHDFLLRHDVDVRLAKVRRTPAGWSPSQNGDFGMEGVRRQASGIRKTKGSS